jgi:NADP-dependent aldehyde dehydrogenase
MTVTSYDPRTAAPVSAANETSAAELAAVLGAAAEAAPVLATTSPAERRRWLYAVGSALEDHRDQLAELAEQETALGLPRLAGEVTRAANQLRFYGDVAVEGSYLDVTFDEATETAPRLVRVNRPLGPVAVFGASNFPFAFSVLGNDTGAAIAAGCPVIAKAHEAHVGLSVLQVEIARKALESVGAPDGALQLVVGRDTGARLVSAPDVTAVAFTGSQASGMALWRLANEREVVIPVYAEMGTVNPVVVTRAGAADMAAVAAGLVESFTLGHGQFCTKPGLLLAPAGAGASDAVAAALRDAEPSPVMLSQAIATSVSTGIEALLDAGAELVAHVPPSDAACAAPAAVLRAETASLKPGSRLLEECFGAVVLVCEYSTDEQLADTVGTLQGSLAAGLITGGPADPQARKLVQLLSEKVGRVVVDGWPTGVAFTWAQQHGGPWPATTTPAATSVGAQALTRFLRPVAFQSVTDGWLPAEAREDNPWSLPRRVNGRLHSAPGEQR